MTTRLEILNAMLAVNGESPVSSVDSTDPAAIQAGNSLALLDRSVQARGWWFNREPTFLLSPSESTGEIIIPGNTLAVDPVDPRAPYVMRGNRLYDRNASTYTIGKSVRVDIVLQLEIEELPELAATYIRHAAVKEYYTDDDGDEQKINRLEKRENESFAYLQREQLKNTNVSILNSPQGQKLLNATQTGSLAASQIFNEEY